MRKLHWFVKSTVFGLALACAGCSGMREITQGRVYPKEVQRGTTLDIQVIRRGAKIELTNTTARAFGKSILWLNGRFSREIDGLAIGQSLTIPLKEFKDEFGESFKGGGFFAAEKPEMLALAEIQPAEGNEMLGLIVVRGQE